MNRVTGAEVSKCSGVERIRYKHNLSVVPHRTALRRGGAALHLVRPVNSPASPLFVVVLVWFMNGLLITWFGWLDRAEPGDRKPSQRRQRAWSSNTNIGYYDAGPVCAVLLEEFQLPGQRNTPHSRYNYSRPPLSLLALHALPPACSGDSVSAPTVIFCQTGQFPGWVAAAARTW